MQEWCHDYYEDDYTSGCCLNCDNSYDGCLCFACKCRKCYWYAPPDDFLAIDDRDGCPRGVCELAYREGVASAKEKARKEKFYERQREKYNPKLPQKDLFGKFIREKGPKRREK